MAVTVTHRHQGKRAPAATQTGFRADINGLRAWAVIAVVLYHFGVPGFRGGFVGVDVFFVISGFLMTGIVLRGLERGDFSLLRFYLARARRIVPGLAALCAVLLALGWFVLLPPDYRTLGSHALYSLTFLSNIEYWKEAGYSTWRRKRNGCCIRGRCRWSGSFICCFRSP